MLSNLLLLSLLGVGGVEPVGAPQGPGPLPVPVARAQDGSSPIWARSFEEATDAARLQRRLIMLVFLGERCPKCPVLEDYTFKHPRVTEWMERNVIALRLFDDVALAERYSVSRVPAIVLLDRSLQEIDRVTEYLEPPALVIALGDIYEGRGGLSHARRELEANPEDPDAHLALGRVLTNRGRSRDALQHFLWAFDHLRGVPERDAERMGPVLREVTVLTRSLAAATHAIRERRDRVAATLLENYDPKTAPEELLLCAREMVAFDAALNDGDHTYSAWETLRERQGMPAAVVEALFTPAIQTKLLQEQRYQDYLDGIGDPLVLLDARLAELQEIRKALAEAGKSEREQLSAGNSVSLSASWYYEALAGVGRVDEANAIVEMLLALEPTAQSFIAMVGAVHRAGRTQEALALQERGRAALPEGGEKRRFELATTRLLRR